MHTRGRFLSHRAQKRPTTPQTGRTQPPHPAAVGPGHIALDTSRPQAYGATLTTLSVNVVKRGGDEDLSALRTTRPTMRDVAVLAGVSLKTVSRVINDEPGVAATTAGRVT